MSPDHRHASVNKGLRIIILIGLGAACAGTQVLQPSHHAPEATQPYQERDCPIDLTQTHRASVHLKAVTPDTAAIALMKQANVEMHIALEPAHNPKIAVHWQKQDFDVEAEPFLSALLRLCKVYDLSEPENFGLNGWVLALRQQTAAASRPSLPADPRWADAPRSISGPFAVLATECSFDRSVDPLPQPDAAAEGTPPTNHAAGSLKLNLVVLTEPNVTVVREPAFPVAENLVDDQGTALAIQDPPPDDLEVQQQPIYPVRGGILFQMNSALSLPDPRAKMIEQFSGFVRLKVVTVARTYEWTGLDDARPREASLGGVHASIDPVLERKPTGFTISIKFHRDQIGADAWSETENMVESGSRIHIFDRAGAQLQHYDDWSNDGDHGDEMKVLLQVSQIRKVKGTPVTGEPYRLVWDFPLKADDVKVPFAFSKLPLPDR